MHVTYMYTAGIKAPLKIQDNITSVSVMIFIFLILGVYELLHKLRKLDDWPCRVQLHIGFVDFDMHISDSLCITF